MSPLPKKASAFSGTPQYNRRAGACSRRGRRLLAIKCPNSVHILPLIRQGAFATAQLVHAAIKRSTGAFSRSPAAPARGASFEPRRGRHLLAIKCPDSVHILPLIRQGAFATAQLVHAAIKRSTGAFSRSPAAPARGASFEPRRGRIYLQLNVQILYIFCIFFNEFTAGFNIIAH